MKECCSKLEELALTWGIEVIRVAVLNLDNDIWNE